MQYSGEDLTQLGEGYLYQYLISLQRQFNVIEQTLLATRVRELDQPLHPFKPRDWVYVKNFTGKPLEEKWNRPF